MIFSYATDGRREPFDPTRMGQHLDGCVLCGRRIAMVGIFVPATDAMRAAVLTLRRHAIRPNSTACVSYGLCHRHARQDVTGRVEAALVAAAGRVVVQ